MRRDDSPHAGNPYFFLRSRIAWACEGRFRIAIAELIIGVLQQTRTGYAARRPRCLKLPQRAVHENDSTGNSFRCGAA
jgi:hypothetical protein